MKEGRRTWNRINGSDAFLLFGEDHSEAEVEMEIDVAMKDPRTGVVGLGYEASAHCETPAWSEMSYIETYRDIVNARRLADAHDVASYGVCEIVCVVASTANDTEDVAVQVNGVLRGRSDSVRTPRTEAREELTGLPTEPPGIESSMTLLRGSS